MLNKYCLLPIISRQNFIPTDIESSTIKRNVAKGSLWSGVDVGSVVAISFVRSIILARILVPADFGIVAIATVFTQFVLIFTNFGFTASIIYYRGLKKKDISTCWWGNLFINSTAAAVCVIIALGTSKFIQTPEIPLVISILSLQFVIDGIGSINLALLQRLFRFKTVALIKIASGITGFIVIIIFVIIFKMGVFALVWGGLIQVIFSTILYLYFMPWLPSFSVSLSTAKKHLRYGSWFLGVNVVSYINGNLDKMTIGTFLDNTQMGYFEYATRFPNMVVINLGQVLNRVLFSAFSNLQANLDALKSLLVDLFKFNTIIVYPMLAGLALIAEEFVTVLYGDAWRPIIIPMKILCIYGMIRLFANPLFSLANGLGKPSLPFKWALIALPLNAAIFYYVVKNWGLPGVAAGKLFFSSFILLTLGIELLLIIQLPFVLLFKQAIPAVSCCLFMGATLVSLKMTLLANIEISLLKLLILIITGTISYIFALRFFWHSDFKKLFLLMKKW